MEVEQENSLLQTFFSVLIYVNYFIHLEDCKRFLWKRKLIVKVVLLIHHNRLTVD